MKKGLDKIDDFINGLPWWMQTALLILGIDFVHTFFHGGRKADMWHMERHTHNNNGVAVVPSIWDNFRDNR